MGTLIIFVVKRQLIDFFVGVILGLWLLC